VARERRGRRAPPSRSCADEPEFGGWIENVRLGIGIILCPGDINRSPEDVPTLLVITLSSLKDVDLWLVAVKVVRKNEHDS